MKDKNFIIQRMNNRAIEKKQFKVHLPVKRRQTYSTVLAEDYNKSKRQSSLPDLNNSIESRYASSSQYKNQKT